MLETGLDVPTVPEPRAGGGWGRRASLALCAWESASDEAAYVPCWSPLWGEFQLRLLVGTHLESLPQAWILPLMPPSPFRMTYSGDSNHQLGRSSRLRRQNASWPSEAGSRRESQPSVHRGSPPEQRVAAVCRPSPLQPSPWFCTSLLERPCLPLPGGYLRLWVPLHTHPQGPRCLGRGVCPQGSSGEPAAGAGPLGATFGDTCPSWLPHGCSFCGLSGEQALNTSLSHKSASQGRLLGLQD